MTKATFEGQVAMPANGQPDHLVRATFMPPSTILLAFEDGRAGLVDLADLGLDARRFRLPSVRASSWGSAVEIDDVAGHTIHIDASVLRARTDPAFAQELRAAMVAEEQSP